jgi:hypothetical protein
MLLSHKVQQTSVKDTRQNKNSHSHEVAVLPFGPIVCFPINTLALNDPYPTP